MVMKKLLAAKTYILPAILMIAFSLSAQAQDVPVRYVSIKKGSYANDGRSWAGAKNNLQDAIEDLKTYMAANSLTEGHVYVSAGRYTPTTATPGGDGTLYTSFIIYEGIKVYGGFDADTPESKPEDRLLENGETVGTARGERWKMKNETTLSGNHTNVIKDPLTWNEGRNEYAEAYTGNSYHVVWFASNGLDKTTNRALPLNQTTVLDGFTVRDGYAYNRSTPETAEGKKGYHAYHNSYGAGIYMVAGSEVRNCIITQNASSLRGGGVYLDGGGLLEQCHVTRNQSAGVGVTDGYGGGVAIDGPADVSGATAPGGMVRHCLIENNVSRAGAGVSLIFFKSPGEDYKLRYSSSIVGCVINNNTSTAEAGGVYLRNGGALNHVTIARNKCAGVSVAYGGRKYARSGGLHVDGGAIVMNSVLWGNEVKANNDVQFATYRDSASMKKTTLAYVALSRNSYVDWSGTIKLTNGVYSLSDDNNNTDEPGAHPEFVTPTPTAGVLATDVQSDWTPRFFSYLRHKGMQVDDYPGNDNIIHTKMHQDYVGDYFAPRCAIGALVAYNMNGANATGLTNLENDGKAVRTVFVDPEILNNTSMQETGEGIGGSWDRPFHNINDAIRYITNELTGTEAPSDTRPIQIVVKQGTCTTAGNAYQQHLRASTLTIPGNVRMYGGFPAGLTGTDISKRNPKETPTRITANIVGGDYKDNGTHIIVLGYGASNVVVDGFQLYYANTRPNKVLTTLGLEAGAGIAVLNGEKLTTGEHAGEPTGNMKNNVIRNCVVANCTAPQGAGIYMQNYPGRIMELQVENCIFHNNAVTKADNGIIVAEGTDTKLSLDHCLIRGNVGHAVVANENATVTVTNTAVHANIMYDAGRTSNMKVAELKAETSADPNVVTFKINDGGTITGSNNMMDYLTTEFTSIAQPVLRYHTTYTNENPNFVNPTNNIGVNEESDVTTYGGTPDWMPTNTNPMVNAAADAGMNATDLTCNQTRNRGGSADIGALENTYQPEFERVVYVRVGGTGDGSSWDKAMGDVQEAVDEAYNRMMGNKSYYQTITTTESREYTDWSDGSKRKKKNVTITHQKTNKPLVQVWVAAGTYTKSTGYTIKNNVTVYGAFPATGNPGMTERHPLLTNDIAQPEGDDFKVSDYETILQVASSVNNNNNWVRVLTHPNECRTTTGDGSDVPDNHIIYDNVRWDGFTIRHGRIGPKGGRNGGAGVNLFENITLSNCVVRDNKFSGSGTGRGGGVYCDGSTIENCYIYNNDMTNGNEMYGAGIYAIDGHIYNSVFSKNNNSGSTHPYGCGVFLEFAKFYNNTIVNNTGGAAIHVWTASGASASLTVYNTIVIGGSSAPLKKQGKDTQVNFYNCYLQGRSYETSNNEANAYTTANNNILYLGSGYNETYYHPFAKSLTEANNNNDYRLAGTSRCLNTGTDEMEGAVLPDDDMDYTDRVKDCTVDIGAYEYNGAQDITPDLISMPGYAVYYVTPFGAGNASAGTPENAACWMKLQQVLDAAGRYTYDHRNDKAEDRRIAVVKLAGDSKKDRTIHKADGTTETVKEYSGFTYRPTRSCQVISPSEEENQRDYSLMVPHGVQVWGGYPEDFKEENRDVLEYRTSFSGIFRYDDVDVEAYNVVTFTNNVYDANGHLDKTRGGGTDVLVNIPERAVLDGLFLEDGKADGERAMNRAGGAAIVPEYGHIRNCIVQNNMAADKGGGLLLLPKALVSGSIIQYNSSNNKGGGLYIYDPKEDELENYEAPSEPMTWEDYAHIYTSDIIYNTANRGGGLYFTDNVRANSSLFWQNTGSEMANIAGQTAPTDVNEENHEPGIHDYPISFCATETTREPGINNIIVNTDPTKGVRFEKEAYNHDYTATDGTPVTVMHNEYEFYQLNKYSLIVRSGMQYDEYEKLLKDALMGGKDGLLRADMAGVNRADEAYDNEFIDIGARAYAGKVLPEVNDKLLMTRIFVGRNEDEVSMDAVDVMRNQTQSDYYRQEGSSFAYPMRYLGDALEYIRTIRKKTQTDGGTNYLYNNKDFEIIICGGTYFPRRNIKGEYVNGRGCTFLVPEGVTIVGGVKVKNNDNTFYANDSEKESGATYTYDGKSVTLDYAGLEDIIKNRRLNDINHNSITEPWEMEEQTILSGQVVNAAASHNVYHIITCVADEHLVGGLPEHTFDYSTVYGDRAGIDSIPALRGKPIVIDGVNMEDGMALNYQENAVNSTYSYYKGGAICVEGNWTTGESVEKPLFRNHEDREQEEHEHCAVGYRNIPLEVRNCTFMNNGGGRGGAIFTDGELKVFACNFAQNYARVGSDKNVYDENLHQNVTMNYAGRGGAINAAYETVLFNSIFANNEADPTGTIDVAAGKYEGVGGAVQLGTHARVHAVNCDFVRNLAAGYPAIYCYRTNKGVDPHYKDDIEGNLDHIRFDNPHKVVNSIFWGNEATKANENPDLDHVFNYAPEDENGEHPEALWFCAYEGGKGNTPVYSHNNVDYRLQRYDGYILKDDEERYTGNPTYIPYQWALRHNQLDADNTGITEINGNPDTEFGEHGLVTVTNNILINSDNNAIDGPNFISPSNMAGKDGFYISADWMIGRMNNLVDNGWTYLQQDLSGNEPTFVYADKENKKEIVGAGIYRAASHDFGKLSEERTVIAIGDDLYMSYDNAAKKPILRVSHDPNPTHHQTFIDLGVYEYQHVKLTPDENGEVDVLWVTEREKTGGAADGKTWATATSDLQRAIETLLASRNGHDKRIHMLEGNYQPVYTINGNLAFTATTNLQTGILLPNDEAKEGVRSLTIQGGYSKDLEYQFDIEQYPVHLYASERTGGDLNFNHVFVIDDMRQRISYKNGTNVQTDVEDYVVPVTVEGLNFSNVKAGNNDGGVALQYKTQYGKDGNPITNTTYWHPVTGNDHKTGYINADKTGGNELYKLTLSQCSFYNNGAPTAFDAPPAVSIEESAGTALIYNSLFHSNQGKPLQAADTKVVNCTFGLNMGAVQLTGTASELHNSILWRNHLSGEDILSSEDNSYDLASTEGIKMTNNAITKHTTFTAEQEADNNVILSTNNNDALQGPNFFNPDENSNIFVPEPAPATRDFHVNPSSKILSKGSVDKYVQLVKDKTGKYPYTGSTDNAELVKMDKDLAYVTRLYGKGLERGAYECVALMNRVLYVNPHNAIAGNGVSWEHPYGRNQIQTAIDAAAVYYDVNHNPENKEEERAYVFVKGDGEPTGETLIMREGVSLYGSIDLTATAEVKKEDGDTYKDENIRAYIKYDLPDQRTGLAMGNNTIVSGVKAGTNIGFGLFDGLQIGNSDDTPIEIRTEPVVALGQGSTVALTNSIIANNRMTEGINLIENHAGLLYDLLIRDNGKADVSLGTEAYALNCTFAGDENSWTRLQAASADHSINNIIYKEGEATVPFAPYFRPSEALYHAGDVPHKDNRNLWYQLHERAPQIGTGDNGDATNTGKSLLPETLQPYIDFTADRDLLGNPRLLNGQVDLGCYETWATGAETMHVTKEKSPENYAGHRYPHEGSVVYLQQGGNLVCDLKEDNSPWFTTESPLKPGYVLAQEGGSLYGQGNEIRLHYVAAERNLSGQYALVAAPFTTPNDGNHITRPVYDAANDNTLTEVAADDILSYYDGEARSQWNYEFKDDNSDCWKPLTADAIEACDGFLMERSGTGEETIRLTAYDRTNAPYQEGPGSKVVTLTQHDQSDVNKDSFHFTSEYNMGWNLKGLPYLIANYNTGKETDGREAMFVPHVVYTMNPEGNYSTAYSWNRGENTAATLSTTDAFFTQTSVIGDNKTENIYFSLPLFEGDGSGTRAESLPALTISADGYGTDRVAILPATEVEEETRSVGSLDYRFGADGVKFAALSDTLPQIAVSGTNGVGLSLLSHAPQDEEIPLTVEVKGEAAYTFSLPDKDAFASFANVYLKDHATGAVTSLITGDYTTAISPDDSPARFSLCLGENPEWSKVRAADGTYHVNGYRMKKMQGKGVYIEVRDGQMKKILK